MNSEELLKCIAQIQSDYILEQDPRKSFVSLLEALIQLTKSEYGFISEVFYTGKKEPYLKTLALTNIGWTDEIRQFCEENAPVGMEFYNLKTLFGSCLVTKKFVISNDPLSDPRSGGIPDGHPPLHSFLGIPFLVGEEMIGMVGLANREGGYHMNMVDQLRPVCVTCANIIVTIRNQRITGQLQAGQAELNNYLKLIFSHLKEAIILTNIDREITLLNESACKMLERPQDQVRGQKLTNYLKFFAKPDEGELLTIHGSRLPVEYSYSQILVGATYLNCYVLRDISQKKEVELLKDQFVSVVSHELKTPLTSIYGSLKLLQSDLFTSIPEDGKTLLNIAANNIERLTRIITNLLDMEKIKQRKILINLKPVKVNTLIQEVFSEIDSVLKEKKITTEIESEGDFILNLDPDRFNQVITNLMSNAIKFSPEHSVIKVTIKQKGSMGEIRIIDQGTGIEKEDQKKLFQMFSQIDGSMTRSAQGSGIGLFIVKSLVELMEGEIDLESQPQVGSQFILTFPLAQI